jgi:hypothetical protein
MQEDHMLSRSMIVLSAVAFSIGPVSADVLTDWNEKSVALVTPRMVPAAGGRVVAMVHVAMFDAINSIERRYRPYLVQLPAASDTSKDAAAAAAAAAVLAGVLADAKADLDAAAAASLAKVPDGDGKTAGIALGQAVAAKILAARADDGADAPDSYRPRTSPGVYVPTPITVSSTWPNVRPFGLTSPSQFRAPAPVALASEEWAKDYNEIKAHGAKASRVRSPRQTEDARFWLITGPQSTEPVVRQIVAAKKMELVDAARFMALTAVAAADAAIAVMDAKYHYNFWRPITAIRNGDIDGNAATEPEATWQPIDNTPMHPEYPCAHCIVSMAVAAAVEEALGTADIPEVAMTSPTAPGVTHRWTNARAWADEVAYARIWAGFHYRFSVRAGQQMGREIGTYAVRNLMPPAGVGSTR